MKDQKLLNDERPSQPTTPSLSSKSLRAEAKKPGLTPAERTLIEQICFAWAEHQGWPKGAWPANRRYDAVLITTWARRMGGSIQLWKAAIARVPKGAAFTALTTAPAPGRTSLLEDVLIDSHSRDAAWAHEKRQHAEESKTIGAALRRLIGSGNAD